MCSKQGDEGEREGGPTRQALPEAAAEGTIVIAGTGRRRRRRPSRARPVSHPILAFDEHRLSRPAKMRPYPAQPSIARLRVRPSSVAAHGDAVLDRANWPRVTIESRGCAVPHRTVTDLDLVG